jgi:type IV secretory pathway TrbD component
MAPAPVAIAALASSDPRKTFRRLVVIEPGLLSLVMAFLLRSWLYRDVGVIASQAAQSFLKPLFRMLQQKSFPRRHNSTIVA